MNQPNNDLNEQARLAWEIIETTNTNLFLTGKAGTGKTTFLRRLKNESSKRIVVVAPTGIAAINAEGVTIHSFSSSLSPRSFPTRSISSRNSSISFRGRRYASSSLLTRLS